MFLKTSLSWSGYRSYFISVIFIREDEAHMVTAVSGDEVSLFFAVIGKMGVVIRQLDLQWGDFLLEMALSVHQERGFKL